ELQPARLELARDRERADGVAPAADAEHERPASRGDQRLKRCDGSAGALGQARTGVDSATIERIESAARSNSSSAIPGVPSKGRSRSISTHERQPWYSSRTRTVTGRGMR